MASSPTKISPIKATAQNQNTGSRLSTTKKLGAVDDTHKSPVKSPLKTDTKNQKQQEEEKRSDDQDCDDFIKLVAKKRISKIVEQTETEYNPKIDWQDQNVK